MPESAHKFPRPWTVTRSAGGYSILDVGARPSDGDAAASDARILLAHLVSGDAQAPLRAINVAPGDPLDDALNALRCPAVASQRELRLDLA